MQGRLRILSLTPAKQTGGIRGLSSRPARTFVESRPGLSLPARGAAGTSVILQTFRAPSSRNGDLPRLGLCVRACKYRKRFVIGARHGLELLSAEPGPLRWAPRRTGQSLRPALGLLVLPPSESVPIPAGSPPSVPPAGLRAGLSQVPRFLHLCPERRGASRRGRAENSVEQKMLTPWGQAHVLVRGHRGEPRGSGPQDRL